MKKKKVLIIAVSVFVAVAVITVGVIYALSNYFNSFDMGIIGGADGPTAIIVDSRNEVVIFSATVIEAKDDMLLVEPDKNTAEIKSSDKIYVNIPDGAEEFKKGDSITIAYDGQIQETYPAQINGVYYIEKN